MEAGAVVLSLEQYNLLLDCKKALEEKKIIVVNSEKSYGEQTRYMTNEKAVEEIALENKALEETMNKANDTWQKTRSVNYTLENELEKVKKMSYWQFRKWRKS